MLRHLFKLIWNKKGTHSLLIIEVWAAFMVLFGVLTLIVFNLRNYLQPIGFQYEQVWNLELATYQDTTEIAAKLQRTMQRIKSYPEVVAVSRMSSNTPFSANQIGNSVTYNKVSVGADFYYTDGGLSKTLDLPLKKGKWYAESDQAGKFVPLVINQKMRKSFFQANRD
jgi:putative ABC transport system permease protein